MWSNDINQGREDAEDVPESDQWDEHIKMPKIPKGWVPENYHKHQTMTGYNGKGVAREVQDELFLSRQCRGNCPNPHDGHKEGTRWSFHFPANFHGQTAVNKAVALRRICCRPQNYDFNLGFKIKRDAVQVIKTNTYFTITSKMDIYEAIGIIVFKVNEELRMAMIAEDDDDWVRLLGTYRNETREVVFEFQPTAEGDPTELIDHFEIELDDPDDSFYKLMNWDPEKEVKWNEMMSGKQVRFPNVWNRQDLYFHGSFVNHTAFNYLGKAGDFYPEPSKLYKADNSTQEFFLEISLDGMTPIDLPYEDFDVELSLIVDTETAISF
jgi:hypothetical protein